MTIRERLADWLTGGALTEARERCAKERAAYLREKAEREVDAKTFGLMSVPFNDLLAAKATTNSARRALRAIAAMETPGAAPAAKRMAKVAREALS